LCQRQSIDSLLREINTKSNTTDSTAIQQLVALSFSYYQINADSAIYYAQQALTLAEDLGYTLGTAMAYNRLGVAYGAKGNYIKALENYYNALRIIEKIGNEKWLSSTYNNLGYIYIQVKDYPKALELTEKSYQLSKKNKNEKALAVNLTNIAWLNELVGRTDLALVQAYEAMRLAASVNDDYHVAISWHIAGRIYLKLKNTDSAYISFSKGLEHANKAGIKIQIAYNTLGIGDTYLLQYKAQEAIPYLESALATAKDANAFEVIAQATRSLVDAYVQTNNLQKANGKFTEYLEIKDSLQSIDKQKTFAQLQLEYDLNKKQKELQLQTAALKQQRIIAYAALSLAAVATIMVYFLYRQKLQLKRVNQLIQNSHDEMRLQKSELIKQAEELKVNNQHRDKLFSIIAHDLRSPMATLRQTIENLNILTPENITFIKDKLSNQFKDIDVTLTNLLQWSHQQLSGDFTQKNNVQLATLLDSNVQLLRMNANDKRITIQNNIAASFTAFADEQQISIAFRNILSNAIKFTNSNGRITLFGSITENNMIEISITDDGIGMSEEQLQKLFNPKTHFTRKGTQEEKGVGLGLLLCKEFIEKNDGTVHVTSIVGSGTTFYIRLPQGHAA
jgi:signal transduction histidine kinase